MQVRPRRSVLYMPGSNQRALEKARSIPADALILDLEDAVAPDAKLAARITGRYNCCNITDMNFAFKNHMSNGTTYHCCCNVVEEG